MKVYAFRLHPGSDLKKEIIKVCEKIDISAGWVCTCVGSLTQTNIRFANQDEGVMNHGYFEIISLTGTVSKNGCHLHIGISDSMGVTSGGHLLDENLVYTTAEIVIGYDDLLIFTRQNDGSTKWAELHIERKGS
jgi:uncharacterized protein